MIAFYQEMLIYLVVGAVNNIPYGFRLCFNLARAYFTNKICIVCILSVHPVRLSNAQSLVNKMSDFVSEPSSVTTHKVDQTP